MLSNPPLTSSQADRKPDTGLFRTYRNVERLWREVMEDNTTREVEAFCTYLEERLPGLACKADPEFLERWNSFAAYHPASDTIIYSPTPWTVSSVLSKLGRYVLRQFFSFVKPYQKSLSYIGHELVHYFQEKSPLSSAWDLSIGVNKIYKMSLCYGGLDALCLPGMRLEKELKGYLEFLSTPDLWVLKKNLLGELQAYHHEIKYAPLVESSDPEVNRIQLKEAKMLKQGHRKLLQLICVEERARGLKPALKGSVV